MTPQQIELARHALGLTRQKQSYRNYFCAGPGHSDHDEWLKMVAEGDAIMLPDTLGMRRGDNLFHLTRAGAEKAIQPGETLGPGRLVGKAASMDLIANPDIAKPTGNPEVDSMIHRLLDAQQDINFHANCEMSQSLCDAVALIDDAEALLRKLAGQR